MSGNCNKAPMEAWNVKQMLTIGFQIINIQTHAHTRHMKVTSSFRRKTRRLLNDVVLRGEQGTKDGKKEVGAGTRTRIGMGMRTGMGARTTA